jgi:competence ComEA-like helix-hairpin-helix protein
MANIKGKAYAPGVYEIDGSTVQVLDQFNAVTVGKAEPAALNVNTASVEELESLDGISEAIAKRLIKARPFEDVDDLTRVRGIGQNRVDALRDRITA